MCDEKAVSSLTESENLKRGERRERQRDMQRSGIMCVGALRKSKFTRRMNRHLPLSSKRGNKHYNKGRGVKREGRVTVRRSSFFFFRVFVD